MKQRGEAFNYQEKGGEANMKQAMIDLGSWQSERKNERLAMFSSLAHSRTAQ